MFNSIIYSIRNTFNINDRSSRKEYWIYIIFFVILITIVVLPFFVLGLNVGDPGISIIFKVIGLIVSPTGYAILVRRLHDIGLTGWIIIPFLIIHLTDLFAITPLYLSEISGFSMLLIGVFPGKNGSNKYGEPPIL